MKNQTFIRVGHNLIVLSFVLFLLMNLINQPSLLFTTIQIFQPIILYIGVVLWIIPLIRIYEKAANKLDSKDTDEDRELMDQ